MTSGRPLKVGYFVGSIQGGMRDGALRWSDLVAMAKRVEEVGFDSFWIPDHLLFRFPGQAAHAPWEGWSLLCGLAAVTSRIEIGSLVACTSYRNPALLAKMADTLDEISGGRLILGLGAGWHEPEYAAFGYPFDHRLERFEEAVHVIKTLLRTGAIDHDGTYYKARDCELLPRGPRPEGPPILIGSLANKPRILKLAATYADAWNGWLLPARSYADQIPEMREKVDAACGQAGRDPSTLERTVGIGVDQREDSLRSASGVPSNPLSSNAFAQVTQQPLTGTPQEIAAELRRFGDEGISHIQIAPIIDGLPGIEKLAPVMELLKR